MKEKYGVNNIRELFYALLPVQIFSNLTSSLSGIVNGLVIGRYLSNLDMVALGFAAPITAIIGVFATIVSSGSKILCGKYIGRGEKDKVNETFTISIYLLIGISVVLTLLGLFFSRNIAAIIGTTPDALDKTTSYIRGLSIGILPTIVSPCLMVFLQMQNESNYALASTVVLAGLNLTLGISAMRFLNISIFGVGIVTSISQYLTLLFLMLRFFTIKTLPRIVGANDKSIYKDILLLGLPTALAACLYNIRNMMFNVIAANSYGTDAVNALSILNSSCGPFDAINIGVGATQLMLASVLIGEKDKEAVKTLTKLSMVVGLTLAFAKVAIIFVFAGNIAEFYGANESVKLLTVNLYKAYGIVMPVNILTLVYVNVYQSLSRVSFCNLLYVACALIVPVGFAYLFTPLLKINSVWYAYLVAEIVSVVLIYVYACLKKKKLITNYLDVLCLEEDIKVDNSISISIKTMEEVIEVSKKVQDYCVNEKIDKRRSAVAGLCCEEMAANIVEHGFTKSKKKHTSIDVYVCAENNEIIIRIKDNAVAFDPHVKIHSNDDPTTNVGIKMVSKLAKEMSYQNTFGLNVLTITL